MYICSSYLYMLLGKCMMLVQITVITDMLRFLIKVSIVPIIYHALTLSGNVLGSLHALFYLIIMVTNEDSSFIYLHLWVWQVGSERFLASLRVTLMMAELGYEPSLSDACTCDLLFHKFLFNK